MNGSFDPADIRELLQLVVAVSSWQQNVHIDRPKLARASRRMRIRNWLSYLRERTGIDGITQLQRVLDPECFYRDERGWWQHTGKWSGYESRDICPRDDLLLRVNLVVPGSYLAFHEPALAFVSDERPLKYMIPKPPHGLPFENALMRREGLARNWRDSPTKQTMCSLFGYRAPLSLAYTCRFWLRAFELQTHEAIPQIVSWVYGHLLINLMEFSRRGIVHEVLQAYDEKIFRCTEIAGRFPRLLPWLVGTDALLLHAASIVRVPKRGRHSDMDRRAYMADLILGYRLSRLTVAFEPVWEPSEPTPPAKDRCAMEFLAKKEAAHLVVRSRLGVRFWELYFEFLREAGRQAADSTGTTPKSKGLHEMSSKAKGVQDLSSWPPPLRDMSS